MPNGDKLFLGMIQMATQGNIVDIMDLENEMRMEMSS